MHTRGGLRRVHAYALLHGGERAQREDQRGDDGSLETYHGGEDVCEKVWVHTMEVIDTALRAGCAENVGDAVMS